ncbi:MAG: hypothetical protein V5A88_10125 [Candidatus Thermoplasmatota archaeon]
MGSAEKLEKGKIEVIEGEEHRPVSSSAVKIVGSHDGIAIIMDGSSTVDPYFMVSECKKKGYDERQILKKIIISRAFTPYQFVDLLEKAERILERKHIIFMGAVTITSLFEDEEMNEVEMRWTRTRAIKKIKSLVREKNVYSVIVDPETNIF